MKGFIGGVGKVAGFVLLLAGVGAVSIIDTATGGNVRQTAGNVAKGVGIGFMVVVVGLVLAISIILGAIVGTFDAVKNPVNEDSEYAIPEVPYGGPYHILTSSGKYLATFDHDTGFLRRVGELQMSGDDLAMLQRCTHRMVGSHYTSIAPPADFVNQIRQQNSFEGIKICLPNGETLDYKRSLAEEQPDVYSVPIVPTIRYGRINYVSP